MDNLRNFYDQNIDGVALANELVLSAFNHRYPNRHLRFTKDRLYMTSLVFLFPKKSMLTRVFNDEILKLKEFGLNVVWKEKSINLRKKDKSKKTEPTKLAFDNILAAFQICGVLYVLSFFVFVLEIMSVKYPRIKCVLDFFTY